VAVGVGRNPNHDQLLEIVNNKSDQVFSASSFSNLYSILDSVKTFIVEASLSLEGMFN